MAQNMYVYVAHKSETDINTEEISRVLVLVAGLKIVLAQLFEGTRKVTSIKGQQGTSDEQRKSQRSTVYWCSWLCATGFLFFPIFFLFFSSLCFFCEFSFFSNIFFYIFLLTRST